MIFGSKENLPKYLVNRAVCHFILGDNILSLQDSIKALEYDKCYERAYEQISNSYFRLYELEAVDEVIKTLQSINPNNPYISDAKMVCCYFQTIEKQAEEFGRLKDFKNAILSINSALKVEDGIQHFHLLKIRYSNELEKLNEVNDFSLYFSIYYLIIYLNS